ncbi:MAG: hypothetical protein IJL44_07485 [Bacteroidales bacterium]|nr:hypothetical protein [Bacteroidales bacterium]
MKRLLIILSFVLVTVSGFGQDNHIYHAADKTITIETTHGANLTVTKTRSVYGKVRIVDRNEECPDVRVWFVEKGHVHDFGVNVVNHAPKDGEWQFVTKKGEEDYTIGLTGPFQADVFVYVRSGYNPQTKEYVK